MPGDWQKTLYVNYNYYNPLSVQALTVLFNNCYSFPTALVANSQNNVNIFNSKLILSFPYIHRINLKNFIMQYPTRFIKESNTPLVSPGVNIYNVFYCINFWYNLHNSKFMTPTINDYFSKTKFGFDYVNYIFNVKNDFSSDYKKYIESYQKEINKILDGNSEQTTDYLKIIKDLGFIYDINVSMSELKNKFGLELEDGREVFDPTPGVALNSYYESYIKNIIIRDDFFNKNITNIINLILKSITTPGDNLNKIYAGIPNYTVGKSNGIMNDFLNNFFIFNSFYGLQIQRYYYLDVDYFGKVPENPIIKYDNGQFKGGETFTTNVDKKKYITTFFNKLNNNGVDTDIDESNIDDIFNTNSNIDTINPNNNEIKFNDADIKNINKYLYVDTNITGKNYYPVSKDFLGLSGRGIIDVITNNTLVSINAGEEYKTDETYKKLIYDLKDMKKNYAVRMMLLTVPHKGRGLEWGDFTTGRIKGKRRIYTKDDWPTYTANYNYDFATTIEGADFGTFTARVDGMLPSTLFSIYEDQLLIKNFGDVGNIIDIFDNTMVDVALAALNDERTGGYSGLWYNNVITYAFTEEIANCLLPNKISIDKPNLKTNIDFFKNKAKSQVISFKAFCDSEEKNPTENSWMRYYKNYLYNPNNDPTFTNRYQLTDIETVKSVNNGVLLKEIILEQVKKIQEFIKNYKPKGVDEKDRTYNDYINKYNNLFNFSLRSEGASIFTALQSNVDKIFEINNNLINPLIAIIELNSTNEELMKTYAINKIINVYNASDKLSGVNSLFQKKLSDFNPIVSQIFECYDSNKNPCTFSYKDEYASPSGAGSNSNEVYEMDEYNTSNLINLKPVLINSEESTTTDIKSLSYVDNNAFTYFYKKNDYLRYTAAKTIIDSDKSTQKSRSALAEINKYLSSKPADTTRITPWYKETVGGVSNLKRLTDLYTSNIKNKFYEYYKDSLSSPATSTSKKTDVYYVRTIDSYSDIYDHPRMFNTYIAKTKFFVFDIGIILRNIFDYDVKDYIKGTENYINCNFPNWFEYDVNNIISIPSNTADPLSDKIINGNNGSNNYLNLNAKLNSFFDLMEVSYKNFQTIGKNLPNLNYCNFSKVESKMYNDLQTKLEKIKEIEGADYKKLLFYTYTQNFISTANCLCELYNNDLIYTIFPILDFLTNMSDETFCGLDKEKPFFESEGFLTNSNAFNRSSDFTKLYKDVYVKNFDHLNRGLAYKHDSIKEFIKKNKDDKTRYPYRPAGVLNYVLNAHNLLLNIILRALHYWYKLDNLIKKYEDILNKFGTKFESIVPNAKIYIETKDVTNKTKDGPVDFGYTGTISIKNSMDTSPGTSSETTPGTTPGTSPNNELINKMVTYASYRDNINAFIVTSMTVYVKKIHIYCRGHLKMNMLNSYYNLQDSNHFLYNLDNTSRLNIQKGEDFKKNFILYEQMFTTIKNGEKLLKDINQRNFVRDAYNENKITLETDGGISVHRFFGYGSVGGDKTTEIIYRSIDEDNFTDITKSVNYYLKTVFYFDNAKLYGCFDGPLSNYFENMGYSKEVKYSPAGEPILKEGKSKLENKPFYNKYMFTVCSNKDLSS
jgi:hypothetical protein